MKNDAYFLSACIFLWEVCSDILSISPLLLIIKSYLYIVGIMPFVRYDFANNLS